MGATVPDESDDAHAISHHRHGARTAHVLHERGSGRRLTRRRREQGQVGYQLALSPQGVQVQSTIGHPETVMNLASDSPLTPEKQKQVGLNVASSLIGLPLVNLEKATPSGK